VKDFISSGYQKIHDSCQKQNTEEKEEAGEEEKIRTR